MIVSEFSLRIGSELAELAVVRRFIEEKTTALKVDPSAVYDILLAIDEMVANIIIHGYRDRPGVIEIEIGSVGDSLMVCLRDQAPPFDPTCVLAPDITLPLEKRPLGGLGIHLARHFTDAMSHRVMPQGGNELTLVKQGVVRNDPKEETSALDN